MKTVSTTPTNGNATISALALTFLLLAIGLFVWFIGSSNPVTPAGYVGYLTQGAVFGKEKFFGLQNGPTSPGRRWLLKVTNVSITPYTYTEEFAGNDTVLSKDNLKIGFRIHVVWRVRPDRIQTFVERYSTLYGHDKSDTLVEDAYKNFLREPLRTYARDEVQQLEGMKIKDEISRIGQRIYERVLTLSKETPFEIMSVVVGNIQYPEQVANAVSLKLSATQDLERKLIEIDQAQMDKKKRIVEAEGIAGAMDIVNQKLTPLYVQHEALESQKNTINSPNHTTIYIPVGPMGVPIVGAFNITGTPSNVPSDAPIPPPEQNPPARRRTP